MNNVTNVKRNIIYSTLIGLSVSGAAFAGAHQGAQDTNRAQSPQTQAPQTTSPSGTTSPKGTMSDQGAMTATGNQQDASKYADRFGVDALNDIENAEIMHEGEKIGEIDRLAVDSKTGELLAVVGLNGVLGVNMKEVTIPLSDLEPAGEDKLQTSISKEELQKQRDIDPLPASYGQIVDQK